jgi:putative CocE/NonD family hydrolase
MSTHHYGKDALPRRRGLGYRVSVQYRALRQTDRVRFSSLTGWEAPDPVWWASQGYAVVNCDLRGAGTSEGVASLFSDQEGEDVYDLIEWAGRQSWSTGAVGLLGVSYLAISQWKAAALQPPSLKGAQLTRKSHSVRAGGSVGAAPRQRAVRGAVAAGCSGVRRLGLR